jgi:Ran GTPase-activating protein (RanGAP) involved in mRNA processing and transport
MDDESRGENAAGTIGSSDGGLLNDSADGADVVTETEVDGDVASDEDEDDEDDDEDDEEDGDEAS